MSKKPYGMVCPISMACEILEPRWTIPILTELWSGATRFNDLRRGIGNISPTLLSKRLKELEAHGLIERIKDVGTGNVDYIRTQKAIDLEPVLDGLSKWAQRNVEIEIGLSDANVPSLMWKMRGYFAEDELPSRRLVIQFRFNDDDLKLNTYWALIRPGASVEMCISNPGFDVDLYIETNVISFSALLLARTTVARELDAERLFLSGDALLAKTMSRWLRTVKVDPGSNTAMLYPEQLTHSVAISVS
jgi:DNA-binding HxlR family transcriptional regulator